LNTTIKGPDGKPRCQWCEAAPEFFHYHDTEWGFPVSDDVHLFEKICLEGFQSGLSWRTILAKRENFRAAFHDFDFDKIARFTKRDLNRLLKDTVAKSKRPSIMRNEPRNLLNMKVHCLPSSGVTNLILKNSPNHKPFPRRQNLLLYQRI
jgi:DNA-3-methyladenine glycosylase I